MADTPAQAAARGAAYDKTWRELYHAAELRYDSMPPWVSAGIRDACRAAGDNAACAEGERERLIAQVHDAMPTVREELRRAQPGENDA